MRVLRSLLLAFGVLMLRKYSSSSFVAKLLLFSWFYNVPVLSSEIIASGNGYTAGAALMNLSL